MQREMNGEQTSSFSCLIHSVWRFFRRQAMAQQEALHLPTERKRKEEELLMRRWPIVARSALTAALLLGGISTSATFAQAAPPTARQPLTGHLVPALAHAAPLKPTDPTREIALTISLELQNRAQLNALVQQQNDVHSANYHRYLTPEQYTAQFGPSQASVDAVAAFLIGQGLHVSSVSPNRSLIQVSGSVSAIEKAFGVQLSDFSLGGRTVHAPTAEPTLPPSLAGIVHSIIGLDDAATMQSHLQWPKDRSHSLHNGPAVGYTPPELKTLYDLNPLPANGSGQNVSIAEFDNYVPSDITTFTAAFGLSQPRVVNHAIDPSDPNFPAAPGGSAGEVELDMEVVAGIAPGATQHIYIAPNDGTGAVDMYQQMVNDNFTVVSTSWGTCEQAVPPAYLSTLHAIFAQGAAQGISIFAAAGDSGAWDCAQYLFTSEPTVDFPASDPNVVGVGGTTLEAGPGGTYQSESVWSCQDCGFAPVGGGGGISGSGSDAPRLAGFTGFAMPAYQAGPGVQNRYSNGKREVPDISAAADPTTGYAMFCSVTTQGACVGGWAIAGGTSAAAPLWAAITADVNQYVTSQGKQPISDIHGALYHAFNTPQPFAAFHDVTSGDNLFYPATAGYDLGSGIGTPDAWNLARDVAADSGSSSPPPPPATTGIINSIAPTRLVDTRITGGAIASGTSRCFSVAGQGGIPATAAGVVLNVTAVGQTTNGWLTVYPQGQAVPATSTLNFATTEYAMANGTLMQLGSGAVCVNVGTVNGGRGSAQVILDATGYLTTTGLAQLPLAAPQRIADTRSAGGPIVTGQSRCFTVAGPFGIPATAAAVVMNVTAVDYGTRGWLTAYPAGQAVPSTSTVNFDPSEYAMANNTIVRVGGNGQVCVSVGTVNGVAGASDVVLDVTGYLTGASAAALPMLASPVRAVDTRANGGPIQTGQSRCFTLSGLPATATSAVLNITAVDYRTQGWVTAYPAGQSIPATSTLNFDTTEYAMADGAIIPIGSGGQVCVNVGTISAAPGSADVILDVVGYVAP